MPPPFRNRRDAGQQLATKLAAYAGDPNSIILALPRGGVPVAYEVARALGIPLDVFVVRKLGVPGHRELAMGAIATGGTRVLNTEVVHTLGISPMMIEAVAAQEQRELNRQEHVFRAGRLAAEVGGRNVILIDDGLATGSTMRAAIAALRQSHPARILVAVPVGAIETCDQLGRETDGVICLFTPTPFQAVGLSYDNFDQTTDQEVRALLEGAIA